MKKIILSLMAGMVLFTSCDLLNPNPIDTFTEDNFFTSESNIEMYTNYFYNEWSAYGTGGASGDFYFNTLNDNQAVTGLSGWGFKNVSASDATWNACYTEIRRANILLKHIDEVDMPATSAAYYKSLAHLYRGWQHFCLVRKFGDCYWIDQELLPADSAVYNGPRQDRDIVMDNVLEDLNYAVENMGTKNAESRTAYNIYVAQAMKSRVCLYEGTYAKYHQNDAARAEKYLKEAKAAAEAIINSGNFELTLGPDTMPVEGYRANYNSLDLSGNKEMIMYKQYVLGVLYHATQDYCCGSTQTSGLSRAAFNAYLMKDGSLPTGEDKGMISPTTDTLDYDYKKPVIYHLLEARDPRLAQQIDGYLAYVGNGRVRYEGMKGQDGAAENTVSTGYGILKFDEPETESKYRQATNGNSTDAPIFWLAEILLNHAEACAELGEDAAATASVNKLRARAGMPNLKLQNDPANNMGVSDLIWEVRRERRVELMFDLNDRYWSLIRWHQLDKLDTQKYPEQTQGAWIEAGWPIDPKSVVLTEGDHGYIECRTKDHRVFEEKHYLAPIPQGQIDLNPNLTQNPGW
ncbi:MAG: RagB/SusD family nutrient uptake outer membrane protein [Paludibacteraceae bacterium]|nr:RagB/SusD family nutrient uptake outer membrane protein [Paludibacteraceae bacterium]